MTLSPHLDQIDRLQKQVAALESQMREHTHQTWEPRLGGLVDLSAAKLPGCVPIPPVRQPAQKAPWDEQPIFVDSIGRPVVAPAQKAEKPS